MKRIYRVGLLSVALGLAVLMGCSDSTHGIDREAGPPTGDLTPRDQRLFPDGFKTFSCKTPGRACNPHDPCAFNPICNKHKQCIPTSFMNCNDALSCTIDQCAGPGLCRNIPKPGTCALPVRVGGAPADAGVPADTGSSPDRGVRRTEIRCFKNGDRNPNDSCQICHNPKDDSGTTAASPTKWAMANGGACDDHNPCTKNDYCHNGFCKGIYYGSRCADTYGCTKDICDGKGGCKGNILKKDWCLISGVCYKDNARHPAATCFMCDVSKSQATWTPITNSCTINGKCYKNGDKDSTGCYICDPARSTSVWSAISGLCFIDGKCRKNGDKNSGGCAVCDVSVSTSKWTVKGSACYISGTCYKPKAKDSTGCGICDPTQQKYKWSKVTNACFLSGTCYSPGAKDSTGCGVCDPTKSTKTWTVTGTRCLIAGTCYKPKQTDSTGCRECAPSKSKNTWSPTHGKCFIGASCVTDKATDSTGCLKCDYASTPNAWSAAGTSVVMSYDFEKGTAPGWTFKSTVSSVRWTVSSHRASGGSYALYYGNPSTLNYDTPGKPNSGTATMPAVTLTASKKAGLRFMLYADVETIATYDKLTVYANGTLVWGKNVNNTVTMKVWQPVFIDLSSYAGTKVTIQFEFFTKDAQTNRSEGVLIDDLVLYHGC